MSPAWIGIAILLATQSAAGAEDTFDEVLDRAVERSTQVGVQKATVDSSTAIVRQAWGVLGPKIALDGARTYTSESVSPVVSPSRSLTVDATMNLVRFGADILGIQAATRTLSAERKRQEAIVLEAETDAGQALLSVIQAQEFVKLQAERLESRKLSLEIAQRRYNSGQLPQEEVDRIAIDLSISEAAMRDSEISVVKARSGAEALFGADPLTPDSKWQSAWPWKDQLPRKLQENLPLLGEAIPSWAAAEADVHSAEASVAKSQRAYLPTLDAKGSYGFLESAGVSGTGWTAELLVSLPIFNQLQTSSDVSQREAVLEITNQRLEQAKRTASALWRSARKSYEIAIATAWDRENAVARAGDLYDKDLTAFRQGLRSANDLALDQGRLFDSRTTAIQGWFAAHLALFDLCHSAGVRLRECRKTLGHQPTENWPG